MVISKAEEIRLERLHVANLAKQRTTRRKIASARGLKQPSKVQELNAELRDLEDEEDRIINALGKPRPRRKR